MALPFEGFTVPACDEPQVTIVICAFEHWDATVHCLGSLAAAEDTTPYEVIVVDDASRDETPDVLRAVRGIRILTNPINLGFLRSANRAAALARGRHIVFLNNDTSVRSGWLDALVARADSDPVIGVVGARLLALDGTLQEAGSIVWSDATGWNYGRGWAADDPRVLHTRVVDYCSGAALLVRRELWERVGGFDEQFAPAYYEDTDLAFSARELGYRVVYEPASVVTHLEGLSHGTDPALPGKSAQVRNRVLFANKWGHVLSGQHPPLPELVPRARDHGDPPRLLVVDTRVPDVTRDSGSVRLSALMELMVGAGLAVSLYSLDRQSPDRASSQVRRLGIEVLDPAITIVEHLEHIGPQLSGVWLSRPHTARDVGEAAAVLAPQAPIIYDSVDLHFLRARRGLELGLEQIGDRGLRVLKEYELAAVRSADVTLAISDFEAETLRELTPASVICTVGNVHETPEPAPLDGRAHLLFVGGWEHPPNLDAALVLVHEVMPLLRAAIPGVRLRLVGSHAHAAVRALEGPDIDVVGWVPDLAPILARHKVFVAPLRWGAGVKGKVGQALAHGLPVVTSAAGAEGMTLIDGVHLHIAQEPVSFAARVVELYNDPLAWAAMSRAGTDLVAATMSREAALPRLSDVLTRIGLAGAAGRLASSAEAGSGPVALAHGLTYQGQL